MVRASVFSTGGSKKQQKCCARDVLREESPHLAGSGLPSPRTIGLHSMGDGDDGEDLYDYFESSLESLFGQHQAASGKPGERRCLALGDGALAVEYRIPCNELASNNRLYAHYQWDAGLELAKMLYRQQDAFHAKSVLELGAGTGLPSLVCAMQGASEVLITDYPDKGIITTIKENVALCKVENIASVKGLDWSEQTAVEGVLQLSPHASGFELILCADVLWLSSSHAALLQTIKTLLTKSSSARVLVLSGFHTGRRALTSFFRRAAEAGLCGDCDGSTIYEYNVATQAKRPWSGRTAFPLGQHKSGTVAEDEEGEDNMDDYTERTKWLLHVSLGWSSYKQ